MKLFTPLILICVGLLHATVLELSPQQKEDWGVQTKMLKATNTLPLGEFMAKVTTPPSNIKAITLPFTAIVKQLFVNEHQGVKKGDVLLAVTGEKWLGLQESILAKQQDYEYLKANVHRQSELCKEGIVAQKECLKSQTNLEKLRISLEGQKGLLSAYGASSELIEALYEKRTIFPLLPIVSPFDGVVAKRNVKPGALTSLETPLFLLHKEGSLWLACQVPATLANRLQPKQKLSIVFNEKRFSATVEQVATMVESTTQTKKVYLAISKDVALSSGLEGSAKLTLHTPSLQIPKSATMNYNNQKVLLAKKEKGYVPHPITVVGEDENNYYLKGDTTLHAKKVVVSSVSIFKSMLDGLEGEDE